MIAQRRPWLALTFVGLVTVGLGSSLPDLAIDSTMATIFPRDDPEFDDYSAFKRTFGEDEFIVVALLAPGGDVLKPEPLRRIRTITEALAALPRELGAGQVVSLTSVDDVRASEDGITVTPLVAADESAATLRERVFSNPLYARNLISVDGAAAAINIAIERRDGDPTYKERLFQEVRVVVERERGPMTALYAGIPVLTVYTSEWLRRDMALFIPATIAVIALVLFLTFRSLAGVLLPLLTVGLSVTWTIGFITWLGKSISILSSIVPSLLIAIGSAYAIHVLGHWYQREGDEADGGIQAVQTPVILSALTTAVGFGALMVNDIAQIREFGLFCAFGVGSAALLALVFVPAALTLFPPRPSKGERLRSRVLDALDRLADIPLHHSGRVIAVSVGIVALGAWGVARIRVDTDYAANFKADSAPVRALEFMRSDLSGERPINVVLTLKDAQEPDGAILEPARLAVLAQAEAALRAHPLVGTTLSVGDYLRNLDAAMRGLEPGAGRLPRNRAAAEQLLLLYDRPAELGRFLSADRRAVNVLGRSGIISSEEYLRFVGKLRRDLAPLASAAGLDLMVTGSMYLLSKTSLSISIGQARSLAIATGLIFLIMLALFRSVRLGLIALVPNALPIALNFAAMGALGITLNMGTAIMASMALGVAVDDTIHFMVTYRRLRTAGRGAPAAARETIRAAGHHIVFTSMTNAAGFMVLTLSSFAPLVALGWLTAFTMLTALVADLVLLPALLVRFDR